MNQSIRNIAIIAHVDHGKTTLVDWMLKQTHTFRDNQAEMDQNTILDSSDLEREKGITILAKNTAVFYRGTKINIIDTPGHADFSGEVERVINMADGAILIVDAAEGPLPQTQFVLEQALKRNLKIIVIINKIDRKDADPQGALRETEELFLRLAHTEEHLNFPVLYAIGRVGKVWKDYPPDRNGSADLSPLFDEILTSIPAPEANPEKPFKMLVSTLDFDSYKGTYAIGKVTQGTISPGQTVVQLSENTKLASRTIEQVFESRGLSRVEVAESTPGDIIAVTGLPDVAIGQTLADPADPTGFPAIKIGDPTIQILIAPNSSPLSGREGKFCTARQLGERLTREKKSNIGLQIELNPQGQGFLVSGRGELHLAILIETLRREGYEMEIGKPQVIIKTIDAVECEPYEEVTIDVDKSFIGAVTQEMGRRQSDLVDTITHENGMTRFVYKITSRNLLGVRGILLTQTRGKITFSTSFLGYFPVSTVAPRDRNGVLIAFEGGVATAYALLSMQERGISLIEPATPVYEGMIVGFSNRQKDIDINVAKEKHLTNVRSNAEIDAHFDTPLTLSLEQYLDVIGDDELLEVTPKSMRLRKKFLSRIDRARSRRVI